MELPVFPVFKPIELQFSSFFKNYTSKYESYSDFNFLSLYSWNPTDANCFTSLYGNLIIKIKSYLGEDMMMSVLGTNNIDDTLNELFKNVNMLYFVPEITINSIVNVDRFVINEDRDNFDYILSTSITSQLNVPTLKNLRKSYNRFVKNNPDATVRLIDPSIHKDYIEIFDLANKWFHSKQFDAEKINEETKILSRFYDACSNSNGIHLGYYIKDKLIAVMSNEIFNKTEVVSHFGYIDRTIKDLGAFWEVEACKFFYEHGINYQNHEQDAGILSLRKTKIEFAPVKFLKKYTITKK